MNLLIIGCGQTGAELAGILSREGHDVSVVAESPDAFSLLPEDFSGYRTAGSLIDQDVLRKAGAENCSALAAVSDDDNVNIMVCQIAREEFGITELIACVNDPRREDVYSRLGLRTICPTRITVDSLKGILLPEDHQQLHFGSSTVGFRDFPIPRRLVGVSTDALDPGGDRVLFAVRRGDGSFHLLAKGPLILATDDHLIACSHVD